MITTIVAVMCTALASEPRLQPGTICHEEIVTQGELPMEACYMSQAGIADWKERSRFAGPDWTVARIRCILGPYEKRDAI